MEDGAKVVSPGARTNGAALSRGLEFAAREKGVRFILNRHMDEIIREQQFSGRVVGIRASYSPRLHPQTGARLESLWQNGNVDERRETIYIRARKAIVIGSGGHSNNPQFRSMFYPAWREPAFVSSGWAMVGPRGQDASGIIAGMRVGANLAGMHQNLSYADTFHFPGTLATRDPYTDMLPGHPTFPFRGSTGILLQPNSFQHLVVVNQVGKRFFNEMLVILRRGGAAFPAAPSKGQPNSGLAHKQLDWRNASAENIRKTYDEPNAIHAALAMNEGSQAPDYFSGPIWAIFDRAAVERDKWNIDPPFTSPTNGFFFSADTIEELAAKIQKGHEFQRVPLRYSSRPSGRGTLTSIRATIRTSAADRTRRCTGSKSRRSTRRASIRSGTTRTAACASTGGRRSSTCRARRSPVSMPAERRAAGATSTGSGERSCMATSPERTPPASQPAPAEHRSGPRE